MADPKTQEELVKQMDEGKMNENDTGGGGGYPVESTVKIANVEYGVVGNVKHFEDYESSSWNGVAIIKIYLEIIEGEHKGYVWEEMQGLFNRANKTNASRGFEDKDTGRYVPSTVLGEIIHRIKEHDPDQWEETPFYPRKLKGCVFKIGTRLSGGYIFAGFEKKIEADKEYREKQNEGKQEERPQKKQESQPKLTPDSNEQNRKKVERSMKEVKEEKEAMDRKGDDEIDVDDLPF